MNYDAFLSLVTSTLGTYAVKRELPGGYKRSFLGREHSPDQDGAYIIAEWSTGGVRGGSCWDSSNPRGYTSDEPPAELVDLDKILETVNPGLTFLQYKALTRDLVKTGTYSVPEYYGNRTDYAYKYVELKELYDYCAEKGWLQ